MTAYHLDTAELRRRLSDLAEGNGLILVDVTMASGRRRSLLRVLVDRPGRVTVDECASFSRLLEDFLDRETLFDSPYLLEVSSPGIGRKLESPEDWRRTVGRTLRIELADEVFEARLESCDGSSLSFEEGRRVPLTDIVSASEVL
ncbi:hypothetical protein JW921_11215 [Candidatus Fermentibacterales bacterium]|nr:hypothetical protein [Candidatus Fermentibacterales bacterium]